MSAIKELIGRRFMVDEHGRHCVVIKYVDELGVEQETSPQPMGVLVEQKPPAQGEFAF